MLGGRKEFGRQGSVFSVLVPVVGGREVISF
jgi:hypothetical protein